MWTYTNANASVESSVPLTGLQSEQRFTLLDACRPIVVLAFSRPDKCALAWTCSPTTPHRFIRRKLSRANKAIYGLQVGGIVQSESPGETHEAVRRGRARRDT
jgi:hypothetical protein